MPALFLVVHHPEDPNQPYPNEWEKSNQGRIKSIMTTRRIADLCSEVKSAGKPVYIHRCAWGQFQPVICCSAMVSEINPIDRRSSLVYFENAKALEIKPPLSPGLGQSFYFAEAP